MLTGCQRAAKYLFSNNAMLIAPFILTSLDEPIRQALPALVQRATEEGFPVTIPLTSNTTTGVGLMQNLFTVRTAGSIPARVGFEASTVDQFPSGIATTAWTEMGRSLLCHEQSITDVEDQMSPAKTKKQERFLQGVKHGTIHRKGISPADAARALGDHPPKRAKKKP